MRRLCLALGEGLPLDGLTAAQVAGVFATAWGTAAARTWNRHRAAVRSFALWAGLPGLAGELATALERRAEPGPRAAGAVSPARLDALCALPGTSVRERVLWRLLHESGAGVKAVLALDVEDLDLEDRRARSGDGRRSTISWRSGTARLLPELLAGRTRGPLFLTDRRPGPARLPAADLCPDTGRARLSYERAEYLFKRASGGLTLGRLKP
ncbi:hypothetical protein ACIA8O_18920 [Kitasatospora sp. NPDC051853]|uniref:hypothetical protein n=1 Tax=Kitasatospora sp. NPDC051853 TaxID=3364058 RepID=UPI0037978EB3